MSEGARKGKNFIVVCTSPDICLTPLGSIPVPVPYQIVAHLDQATMPSHNVKFGGEPALLVDQSMVMKVEGNEAGVLGGIKSGHNQWIVEFDEGSSKVLVKGKRVIRHGDTCAFPPVRAGHRETLPGGWSYSHADGPNLAKLIRHLMQNVLQPLESSVKEDRKTLAAFLDHCG